ncbi:MAG TPA: DAK2 domain-containing protein [Ktedonobacterales bacterium]|nr:DAK2 domain-containing protein [Ktedonobacterales bacterium]
MEHTGRRITRPRRVSVFDGQDFKRAMMAGASWLEQNREIINALNVFPVPDGDTGTNMSATMRAGIKEIAEANDTSAGVIAEKLARGALMGARGNSGVILSQILRGLAQSLEKKTTFTAADLAEAFQESSKMAYRAVIKPVEGTILTVIREVAEAARQDAQADDDLVAELQKAVMAARQAVARTPDLLPTLKQAGVVDAGGQGLAALLEGVWRHARGETIQMDMAAQAAKPATEVKKGRITVEEEFGYEVVFLVHGQNLSIEEIRETITRMGGVSTVVGGDAKLVKVHTHTLTPGKILDYGVGLGSLMDINIENLQEQSLRYEAESKAEHAGDDGYTKGAGAALFKRELGEIATVAVAAGEGWVKLFESLGVGAIVPGGQTMNPSTEELLEAVNSVSSPKVILLPNNGNVIMSARQVPSLTEKEVHVVPTDTLPEGVSALLAFNYDADFQTNAEAMDSAAKNVQTAEITTAVRSVQIDGLHVEEGDVIGLLNGRLVVANSDMLIVIQDTLKRMKAEQYEIFTLYYGEGVTRAQADETASRIKAWYPDQELEVLSGNQPYYAYILSAE